MFAPLEKTGGSRKLVGESDYRIRVGD